MSKRISELAQVFQTNPGDLVEIAIEDPETPTGYSSRKIEIVDLTAGGGLSNRFLFSGTETLDEFVSWQFSIPYQDLDYLADGYPINDCGSATLNISLSVFQNGGSSGGKYGSTSATIIYSTDDFKQMNYMSSGGLNSAGSVVSLPLFPPSYSGSMIPPIITNVLFDAVNEILTFTVSIATDVYSTPPSGDVIYSGFVDITLTPYIYGT